MELYGCEQTKYGSNGFLQTVVTNVFRNLNYKPTIVRARDCMTILIGAEEWSGRKY